MSQIVIISGSVRNGRKSHHVANHINEMINSEGIHTAEILDLQVMDFPVLKERLMYLENPPENLKLFSEKIKKADAVILVSPEYNGSIPAAVKNAIDALVKEWYRKPIGIVGVSSGSFGGIYAIRQLQSFFLKVKAAPLASLPFSNVEDAFNEAGIAQNKEKLDKRISAFLGDLLWVTEAFSEKSK